MSSVALVSTSSLRRNIRGAGGRGAVALVTVALSLVAALALSILSPGQAHAADPTGLSLVWKESTGLEGPNAPLLIDLFHDERPELVLTDTYGHVQLRDATTGKRIAAVRLGEGALTSPVAGEYLGDGRLHIAVGTKDGRIVFLDGASLRTLAEGNFSAGQQITAPPTTVQVTVDGKPRDAVVYSDLGGAMHCVTVGTGGAARELWNLTNSAVSTTYPATFGPVRSEKDKDVVWTSASGTKAIVINPSLGPKGGGLYEKYLDRQAVRGALTLASFDAESRSELVILNEGRLDIRRMAPGPAGALELNRFWTGEKQEYFHGATVSPEPPDPVVIPDVARGYGGTVIACTGSKLFALIPETGRDLVWPGQLEVPSGVATSLTLIPREGNKGAAVAFADLASQVWIVDSLDGRNALNPTAPNGVVLNDVAFTKTIVVGCVQGDGTTSLWGITSGKGQLMRYDITASGFKASRPNQVAWQSRGGNVWRSGLMRDLSYVQAELDRQERLKREVETRVAAYTQASSSGNHDEALVAATWLANFDPLNSEYKGMRNKATFRKNLFTILGSTLLGIVIVGFTGLKTAQFTTRQLLLTKARKAASASRWDEAIESYRKVLKRYPKDATTHAALAQVYIQAQRFDPETLETFQAAASSAGSSQDIEHAYARALALIPKTDDAALATYEKVLATSPDTGLLEFAIGSCYQLRSNTEEAAKHLRAAIRASYQDERVYAALCDVYLASNFRQAKAVPIFQQQFPRRQNDQVFLEAYLDACADAKMYDTSVEQLCNRVLEVNPRYVPAYCQLATIRMQARNHPSASDVLDRALAIDSQNPQAVYLRAQLDMVMTRGDDRALANFFLALHYHPNDRDLLRTLSNLLAARQRFDDPAVDIYRRALVENPNDVATLKAMATVGRMRKDAAVSIDAIERLSSLGQMNPELTLDLARAYVAVECKEPKAERVLRDAIRVEANNPAFARLLALVLLGQDKTDPDALAVYERALRENPAEITLGRQLVKALNKNSRFSEALTLAQQLLQSVPNDEELKRLVALSSLYDNKIDQAIVEYRQILSRNPSDRDATVNLALAYAQKARTDDEAVAVYNAALGFAPNNENLHLIMARVWATRGNQEKAAESYQNALKSQPNVEEKVLRHCEALLSELPQAMRIRWFFAEVLVAYNRLREALDQLGLINEMDQSQGRNVLAAIDRVLAKDPKNVLALMRRGIILVQMGAIPDARQTLERAFAIQPNNAEVQTALVSCYEKSLASKDDAEVRFRLGKLYFLIQDYDKAIGCFQKTAQDFRWEGESAKMLGKCFTGKGMLDLALQEFKKLQVDEEAKELLYDLAQRYEQKRDLVGAKTVYRQIFAADINYKDVRTRFENLSGSTSDPAAFEKTAMFQGVAEETKRRFDLLDELGRGAMGIVYRAKDKELDDVVAVKILPDNLSNNPEAVRRFKIEAKNARLLSHPNIIRIHDIGEEMGRRYISMEIVEGTDLKKKLRQKGKFSAAEAVRYSIAIADALGYAHRRSVVHRDIKPANIMITKKDEIKVADFGIAKLVDSTGEGTMIGAVIGTPLYMSPEQVRGEPVDNRADIYAFGIMFYEFLNGRPPFTEGDLAYQHIHKPPEPIAGCPPELWEVIAKCLAKNKEDRWTNAEMIVERLRDLQKTLGNA